MEKSLNGRWSGGSGGPVKYSGILSLIGMHRYQTSLQRSGEQKESFILITYWYIKCSSRSLELFSRCLSELQYTWRKSDIWPPRNPKNSWLHAWQGSRLCLRLYLRIHQTLNSRRLPKNRYTLSHNATVQGRVQFLDPSIPSRQRCTTRSPEKPQSRWRNCLKNNY